MLGVAGLHPLLVLCLWGGIAPSLAWLLQAVIQPSPSPRSPILLPTPGLQVNEFGATPASQPLVKSELVSITPVTLTATPPGGSAAADDGSSAEPEAKRQRVEGAAGGAEQAAASSMDIASVAVEGPAACYVCELPDVPGKFLPQKVRGGAGVEVGGAQCGS